MENNIIYYHDELNDEFSKAKITPRVIDENYDYFRDSFFKKINHFICYRVIATPLAYLYTKIKFHHKIVNKQILKKYKKSAYFIYGNHTQDIGDACIPSMLNFPKNDYVIVHPNNVSMPYLGKVTPYLGAIPLPDNLKASKNFIKVIDKRVKEKRAIVIYPEAHIWPYYTKIRPFKDNSFHYPVKYQVPTFCFTNTYQKRKHSSKPKIVTYIDGPFYPNKDLALVDQKKDLRDQVFNVMNQRSKLNNVVVINYIKGENKND